MLTDLYRRRYCPEEVTWVDTAGANEDDTAVGYSLVLVALVTIPLGTGSLYLGSRGGSNIKKETTFAAATLGAVSGNDCNADAEYSRS